MDSLPLDAVRTAGVGTSVLPADRCHCQAPITHLGPRRDGAQHPLWGPANTTLRRKWQLHAPQGYAGSCLTCHLPPATQTTASLPAISSPSVPLHSVTGHVQTAIVSEKEPRKAEGVQWPQRRPTRTWYFPLAPRSVPSLSQVTIGLGFPKAVQVMVTLPPSLASMYWGGVSVKVGGAAKRPQRLRVGIVGCCHTPCPPM